MDEFKLAYVPGYRAVIGFINNRRLSYFRSHLNYAIFLTLITESHSRWHLVPLRSASSYLKPIRFRAHKNMSLSLDSG